MFVLLFSYKSKKHKNLFLLFISMTDCVFCKIVAGELPCYKLYEDDDVLSFLDINPSATGHLLVIPKAHHENIFSTPDHLLEKINVVCKKMSLLLQEKLGVRAVNIISSSGKEAQQDVFHLHYHVIPRKEGDGINIAMRGKDVETDFGKVHKQLVG